MRGLAVLVLGFLSLMALGWVGAQLLPHPPMTERDSSEYRARLAVAAELNAINPGLSSSTIARTRATVPPLLENLERRYAHLSKADLARVEAIVEAWIAASFARMEDAALHFWATHYSVSDQRFFLHIADNPYDMNMLRRLRLFITHEWRAKPDHRRVFAELKRIQRAENREMMAEIQLLIDNSEGEAGMSPHP